MSGLYITVSIVETDDEAREIHSSAVIRTAEWSGRALAEGTEDDIVNAELRAAGRIALCRLREQRTRAEGGNDDDE